MGLDAYVGKIINIKREEDEEYYIIKLKELESIKNILKEKLNYRYIEDGKSNGKVSIRIGSYSTIHYLRFKAMKLMGYKGDNDRDYYFPLPEFIYFEHLIHHEDNEGYYFPIDFKHVFWEKTDPSHNSSTSFGSSIRLKEELLEIRPHIDKDKETYELTIWGRLYRLCIDSIRTGLPIVFC